MEIKKRAELELYVRTLLGPEKAGKWWRTANPMMGDISPDHLCQMGRAESVYKFIEAAHESNGDAQPATSGDGQ